MLEFKIFSTKKGVQGDREREGKVERRRDKAKPEVYLMHYYWLECS
jgi:hypothetical protein